jgi:hypothetical protein
VDEAELRPDAPGSAVAPAVSGLPVVRVEAWEPSGAGLPADSAVVRAVPDPAAVC